MENQKIFDEISTLDLASIQDDSLKNTFELMFNLIENMQQEVLELKKTNQALRDEINQLKGEQGKPTINPNTKSNSKDISTQGKEREKKKHTKQAKKEHIQIHQTIEVPIDKEALPQDAKLKYWDDVITQTAIQLNVDIFQYIKQMINGDQNRVTLASLILQRN